MGLYFKTYAIKLCYRNDDGKNLQTPPNKIAIIFSRELLGIEDRHPKTYYLKSRFQTQASCIRFVVSQEGDTRTTSTAFISFQLIYPLLANVTSIKYRRLFRTTKYCYPFKYGVENEIYENAFFCLKCVWGECFFTVTLT